MRVRRKYIWALGTTDEGKKILLGPFKDKDSTNEHSGRFAEFSLFSLHTRNKQEASSRVKAALIKKGKKPDIAVEKLTKIEEGQPFDTSDDQITQEVL